MSETIENQIHQLILQAESVIPSELAPELPPGRYTDSQPEWHSFEHKVWKIGERIRQLILKKKSLRSNADYQASVIHICTNRNAKRGRQSFIMLLGFKCCQRHAKAIELINGII